MEDQPLWGLRPWNPAVPVSDNGLTMALKDGDRLPPGRQPYDKLNGLRVGALAGGVLGAVAAAATRMPWVFFAGAVIGGAAGYLTERRKLRGGDPESAPPADDQD